MTQSIVGSGEWYIDQHIGQLSISPLTRLVNDMINNLNKFLKQKKFDATNCFQQQWLWEVWWLI